MDERFEDDVRQETRQRYPKIKLSDGREFTHKQIFDTFIQSGFREDYMKEAMYRIITTTPFNVEFTDKDLGKTIDFEVFIKRRNPKERENSQEVKLCVNGIDSNDERFFEALASLGQCISLKEPNK